MDEIQLKKHAVNVRKNIVRMVYEASSGHIGGSLSATDLLTALYFHVMDINEDNVNTIERDRFVLSKGHVSPLLYSILEEKGLLHEDLATFRQINSKLQGHPNMNYVSGVDMSTGSLGQGISCAVGMAMAEKYLKKNHRIYALLGDGECEEGQVWEACMSASQNKLNNLCAIVDINGLQIDGSVAEIMDPDKIKDKFKAFGWNVICIHGHDFTEILDAFEQAIQYQDGPSAIIAQTIKGKGVRFMENQVEWHGKAPSREQYEEAMQQLQEVYDAISN